MHQTPENISTGNNTFIIRPYYVSFATTCSCTEGITGSNLHTKFKSKFIAFIAATSCKNLALLSLLVACAFSPGHAQATLPQEQEVTPETKLQNTVENLVNIQKSIESKQDQVGVFREKLKKPEDASEKQAKYTRHPHIKKTKSNFLVI